VIEKAATEPKHNIMTKFGQNQIRRSNMNSSSQQQQQQQQQSQNEYDTNINQSAGQTLMRSGKHKLIAVKKAAEDIAQKEATISPTSSTIGTAKQPIGHQRKRPPHYSYGVDPPSYSTRTNPHHNNISHRPTVKRIKLTVPSSQSKDEDDEEQTSATAAASASRQEEEIDQDDSQKNDKKDHHISDHPKEKLTDFAYRQTSRVRPKTKKPSHNMRWSKTSNDLKTADGGVAKLDESTGSRNMGLVRIQPNEKKTPICSTFLRGQQCQNPLCRKRHDVPRDYAMPVCSFFQRHGQCLRGDECIFRHVKVNPTALICPNFSILGFCEDSECSMQHVRGKGGTQKLK
jgi:hypothetical protein